MQPATKGPWNVNAVKNGRVIGDETAETFDKLQITARNCTVATVYRRADARLVANAPAMLALLQDIADDKFVVPAREARDFVMRLMPCECPSDEAHKLNHIVGSCTSLR
jgi:hypothetical protein